MNPRDTFTLDEMKAKTNSLQKDATWSILPKIFQSISKKKFPFLIRFRFCLV